MDEKINSFNITETDALTVITTIQSEMLKCINEYPDYFSALAKTRDKMKVLFEFLGVYEN